MRITHMDELHIRSFGKMGMRTDPLSHLRDLGIEKVFTTEEDRVRITHIHGSETQ